MKSHFSPFEQMQRAVDIVNSSPHPTNKIAATLFGCDKHGREFSISTTNYWPDIIREKIGTETRIGNASGTIHAETACILQAPYTEGAALCITDPFCPNCAKNIAEAGIKTIYIDHKGFQKDFIERRPHAFANMSMRICEKAGIAVYELWRKEQRLVPTFEPPANYIPPNEHPVEIIPAQDFESLLEKATQTLKGHKFACALAKDEDGNICGLGARGHPALGYTMKADLPELENPQGKYSFKLEPVNRILMAAPRHGLKIIDGSLHCTHVPTSRELVNTIGAGLTQIHIADKTKARDQHALVALSLLEEKEILSASG
ncbi:MAG: deoxycytidylate deaminase [Rhodospirillales bacterium]|nr:deoxycytidylate deaminase [Rhodospirillales bacterium]